MSNLERWSSLRLGKPGRTAHDYGRVAVVVNEGGEAVVTNHRSHHLECCVVRHGESPKAIAETTRIPPHAEGTIPRVPPGAYTLFFRYPLVR